MRITQHLQQCECFGISSSSSSSTFNFPTLIKPKVLPFQRFGISSFNLRNSGIGHSNTKLYYTSYSPFITCLHSNSPLQFPVISNSSLRPKDDDLEKSSEGMPSIAGGIVALGKFDALHLGHRELAIQASKIGTPFLLSFVGMAEVLGWAPRAPIVAKCDRERVLSSWAPLCGNVTPKEFMMDFSSVRHLTPRQFVEKLSNELGIHGVVAGENYRFGYKAAGDTSELVKLCDEYGMKAYIISSVMDKNQARDNSYPQDKKDIGQVSSTRVRYALSKGDMNYVSKLLGRQHRLVLAIESQKDFVGSNNRFSAPKSCLLNLAPKEGLYTNCSLISGDEIKLNCRILIDATHIHLESDEEDCDVHDAIKGLDLLGIEFRG